MHNILCSGVLLQKFMRTCNDEETGPSTDSGVPREHNESEDNSPDGQSETTGHNSGLRTLNPLNGNRESPKANDVCLAFKPISARRLGKRTGSIRLVDLAATHFEKFYALITLSFELSFPLTNTRVLSLHAVTSP